MGLISRTSAYTETMEDARFSFQGGIVRLECKKNLN